MKAEANNAGLAKDCSDREAFDKELEEFEVWYKNVFPVELTTLQYDDLEERYMWDATEGCYQTWLVMHKREAELQAKIDELQAKNSDLMADKIYHNTTRKMCDDLIEREKELRSRLAELIAKIKGGE